MIDSKKKAVLAAFILTGTAIIVFAIAQSFKGTGSNQTNTVQIEDTVYNVKLFKLPKQIDFCGEKMPLGNFDTRESLERELLISAYRHSATFLVILRANRYLPVIERILKKNNIPDDFKYLVAAESDFSNMISPAGAVGFWQIMPETGREAGLQIDNVVDERYDLEKSTQFACDYFNKSYKKYGSWTLAAASYDCGRNSIDDQIDIQHQKNYYDLLLTEETARYIFRVIAYKLIINNPENYGFRISKEELYPELKYYEVKIDTAITDLSTFAEKYGTNYKILKYLNPWLRKPYLSAKPNKGYLIKIPSEGMRNIENSGSFN